MIGLERLESVLAAAPRLRIGLVGDLFLDRYLELVPGAHELSIETGLEAYQISRVRNSPGALGTVLNNLAALGVGQLVPLTVLGDDGHGYDLLQELKKLPVVLSHVVTDSERLTPTYIKPLRPDTAGVWQELNRLDVRSRERLRPATLDRLIQNLRDLFHSVDGLIILDQINEDNWGVVNDSVRASLEELQGRHPDKLVFVDSRRHLGEFRTGVLKGNRAEVLAAAGIDQSSDDAVHAALTELAARTGRSVFCTAGERGIFVAGPQTPVQLVPGCPVRGPIDIVGAGDAATSGIVTAQLCSATDHEAAMLGNLAASITVQQLGTTGTASPAQLRSRWKELFGKTSMHCRN